MTAKLIRFEERLKQSVRYFWSSREKSAAKQLSLGRSDQGMRAMVTGGKNLDAFRDMVVDVVRRYGPPSCEVHRGKATVALPGLFRPTKQWDILVIHRKRLLVALELKSLCGPSFGNNANNRCEEALGSAYDFRKAQSEGLFGKAASPFLGYFIFVEDSEASRKPVSASSPHFPTDSVFQKSSYQRRMQILCERMVEQQMYSCCAVLTAPKSMKSGECADLSPHTSFKLLLTRLAGHLAAEASLEHRTETDAVRESRAHYAVGALVEEPIFLGIE